MRSSPLGLVAFIRSRALLAVLLGFSILPAGCFRSRMLNPPKKSCPPGAVCNPTDPKNGDASVKYDAPGDGRRDDGADASDGLRDGNTDVPGDGLRDASADARDAVTTDLLSDSRGDGNRDGVLDGVLDGVRDGVADLVREGRPDSPSDRGTDIVICGTIEICGNGMDDDCNGLKDCVDPACQNLSACIDRKKELCDNGIDDDGNGLIDCKDPACFGDKACAVPGKEVCNNNLDDDDDGLIDCKDLDCANDPTCIVSPGNEICDNGKDDNGDGLVDCTDPQCKTFPACLQSACTEDVDFGAIASSGASVSRTISTVGATASYNTCASSPGGVARVAGFSLAAAADVRMDFTQEKGSAHVVALFRAGVGQTCDQNPVAGNCLDVRDNPSASKSYNALPPGDYWLVIQSYPGTTGSTTVTLSTGKAGITEICDNGKDDDGDGAIDCADLDCAGAPNCALCTPDINLGTLVPGENPKSVVVDTITGRPSQNLSCLDSDGRAVVIGFSVRQTVVVDMSWQQQSGGDHQFGLYGLPPRGESCENGVPSGCTPSPIGSSGRERWTYFAPGDYVVVLKAREAGMEGKILLTLAANLNAGIELCDNGIDDDGDLLVDCDDPDCYGVANCQAPMCLPYDDLGTFDVGTKKSLHVDVAGATDVFNIDCAKGDGVGRAYRMTVASALELDISWNQTGSQAIAVSPQLAPLDRCDAHTNESGYCTALVDAPASTFGWPNLQPGTYYLLVAALAKGSEGAVDLTLRGVYQNILEICNNGIDDDGDGATDCNDEKCTYDASCIALRCRPDEDLGLLAIDGSSSTAVLDTSNNAGDDQHKCVSGSGGADAVAGFTLPGTTDLSITWAQGGNHALGLYKVDNERLPCEANTPIDCRPTNDVVAGSYTLKGLAAGKYNLVVDAENASSEGGVILQISGLPSK